MHEILEKDLCGKIFRSQRRRHTAEKKVTNHKQRNHRRFSDSKRRILINYSKINSRHREICIFIVCDIIMGEQRKIIQMWAH